MYCRCMVLCIYYVFTMTRLPPVNMPILPLKCGKVRYRTVGYHTACGSVR